MIGIFTVVESQILEDLLHLVNLKIIFLVFIK
ncbi:MAG: hypothetical protein RLZZ563_1792, partial [Pseudomonadota bacterium]